MAKGYKHATPEQLGLAMEAYQRTLDTRVAAEASGLSRDQVRGLLHRIGVRPSGTHQGACYRHMDSVRQWAVDGVSVSEIARRVGTTSSKVSAFLRKHSIPRTPFRQEGPNNPAWKGGERLDKSGYVLVYSPSHPQRDRHNLVRKHRLAMEAVLGRYLLPTEVVHHKDDNRSNNDPDNLELFASNGEHLAATLTGKPKNLTPEGRERLRVKGRQMQAARRIASRLASSSGGPPSPDTADPI